MITTADLGHQLNQLNVEFRKIVDKGMTAEALRWILNTLDFLDDLLDETIDINGDISDREKEVLRSAERLIKGSHSEILWRLQDRERVRSAITPNS